jgi:hypothetical protein
MESINMLKQSIITIALLLSVGCASQPSTYTDKSTPERRDIQATGAAATEAARSNRSTNADIRGVHLSSVNDSNTDYRQLPGVCCAYYPDGSRNYQREHDLYVQKQYGRIQRERGNTYSGYASQQWKRGFDRKVERKIDLEVNRVLDKVF